MKSLPYIFVFFCFITRVEAQASPTMGVCSNSAFSNVSQVYDPCQSCPSTLSGASSTLSGCQTCASGCTRWYVKCNATTVSIGGNNYTIKDYGTSFCPATKDPVTGICYTHDVDLDGTVNYYNSYTFEQRDASPTFKQNACNHILNGEITNPLFNMLPGNPYGRLYNPTAENYDSNLSCVNLHFYETDATPTPTPTATATQTAAPTSTPVPNATATPTAVPTLSTAVVLGGM